MRVLHGQAEQAVQRGAANVAGAHEQLVQHGNKKGLAGARATGDKHAQGWRRSSRAASTERQQGGERGCPAARVCPAQNAAGQHGAGARGRPTRAAQGRKARRCATHPPPRTHPPTRPPCTHLAAPARAAAPACASCTWRRTASNTSRCTPTSCCCARSYCVSVMRPCPPRLRPAARPPPPLPPPARPAPPPPHHPPPVRVERSPLPHTLLLPRARCIAPHAPLLLLRPAQPPVRMVLAVQRVQALQRGCHVIGKLGVAQLLADGGGVRAELLLQRLVRLPGEGGRLVAPGHVQQQHGVEVLAGVGLGRHARVHAHHSGPRALPHITPRHTAQGRRCRCWRGC